MGSPKENVAATRAHIKDAEWIRQRDQAIANGDLPKSGFDRSERVVHDVVRNMLKTGKFTIIKSPFQDFRAVLREPRLKGTVFDFDDNGEIKGKATTTALLSCSQEKGYHVYPVKEGDVT